MLKRTIIVLLTFVSVTLNAQLSFQDSATAVGVNDTYGLSLYGGGVSFADFNGDGWDDLTYSTEYGEEVYFYQNNNGIFTRVDLGINDTYMTKQVVWVDYDNDGDKDFFVTSYIGVNKAYENVGGMTFVDISSTCGLFTSDYYTYGMTFGDIDNDGDLDVFISNRDDSFVERNFLYRNDSGAFVDITASAGINLSSELSFCTAFFDYDNDGDQDIYLANDKTFINRLYQNDGTGSFTDVSVSSGAGIAIDAMSTTIGDYDNDGWFDIYITNTFDGNYFLRNNQDGTFTNVATSNGTLFEGLAWGAVFFDADLDTDLDMYVSSSLDGTIPYDGVFPLSAAFYENDGTGNYSIPTGAGFAGDTRESYANAIGDFNNDGLPDIVVMNDTDDYFLWENMTTTTNNYLKVTLEGTTSNRDGVGAKIEISVAGNKQFRYLLCGEGYLSQNSSAEFFGVGSVTNVDYVKVTWLGGNEDIISNVTPNQTVHIVEGSTLSNPDFFGEEIAVYPNPTTGKITITNLSTNFELNVLDVTGKLVGQSQVYSNINNNLDLSYLSSGMYLLQFKSDTSSTIKKVLIE